MNDFLTSIFDFFLPRLCSSCGANLTPGEKLFCNTCLNLIPRVSRSLLNHEFERKFSSDELISDFRSLFIFEEDGAVQKCIHRMKYNSSFHTGRLLGELTARELKESIYYWNADIIIPVPIHRTRRADRGYNQSFYIAKGIAKVLNIKAADNILKRSRYTSTQTALNLAERKINVKDAFILKHPELIRNKKIIMIDDVITTGATISECAKLLIDNGANCVFALSVALAQ